MAFTFLETFFPLDQLTVNIQQKDGSHRWGFLKKIFAHALRTKVVEFLELSFQFWDLGNSLKLHGSNRARSQYSKVRNNLKTRRRNISFLVHLWASPKWGWGLKS